MTFKEVKSEAQGGWVACPESQTSSWQTLVLMSALPFQTCALRNRPELPRCSARLPQHALVIGPLAFPHTFVLRSLMLVACPYVPGTQDHVWNIEEVQ